MEGGNSYFVASSEGVTIEALHKYVAALRLTL